VISPRNQSRALSASPAPEMTKGTIHAVILEQPVRKPYDLQARQGVCWSNKEAKFESVKQAEVQRSVARTSSGERIIRSNACMHRCISLHVIISLVLSLVVMALALALALTFLSLITSHHRQ
jgi:hypothetical protein